ncbi:MAG: histidinol-phosphatase, partial [Oscillospiraceae bacterium]|nr:histidinol-phosphatase [Oscillospiraceae bacterium]
MLIDFHTHLLPTVDDGSQSVAESLEMLDALRLQKVDLVVATPHFYSNKAGLDDFLDQRGKAYNLLRAAQTDLTPELLLGAEVSFFRGIGKADRITELCIAGTNALLIEMPFSQWGRSEISELHQVLDRGIAPIIAHIERYFSFQKDLTALNEIINLPIFLQVNTEALLQRKTRKFVFKLIEHGFPV